MEINAKKQLHKHAAPIVLLLLALFTMTAVTLDALQSGSVSTEIALGRSLVTQVLHVQPTANGLVKITTGNAGISTLTPDINQVGQGTQLTLMLQ